MILLQFKIESESKRISISQIKKVVEYIRYEFGPIPNEYKHRSKQATMQLFFQDEEKYKKFLDRFKIKVDPAFQTNIGMKGIILTEFTEFTEFIK